jgi:hypothetical protein
VRTPAEFTEWASDRSLSLAFAGTDPYYAVGLEVLLPAFRVASTSDSPALRLLAERGVPTFAPDNSGDRQAPRSTAALLEDPGLLAFLGSGRSGGPRRGVSADAGDGMPGDPPNVSHGNLPDGLLVFKSSHRIESRCAELGLRLLAAPAALARRWENKVAFVGIAEQFGLPTPRSRVVELRLDGYDDVRRELGERFVLQAPHGFGGARTMLVNDLEGYQRAAERIRSPLARATRLVEGIPLTVNACVTARGIACSGPFGQATGLGALTPHPLGSCGNDWSWAPARCLDSTPFVDITRTVGRALAEDGYRGVYGVDFVLGDDGQPYVIEVNPRLVASIALYTQLELEAGRLPLLARHVLAFLDPEADTLPLDTHLEPVEGSQVIVHELSGESRVVGGAVPTGAYGVTAIATDAPSGAAGVAPGNGGREQPVRATESAAGTLSFRRSALRVDELAPAGEVLVLAPSKGVPVSPGAAFARVQLRGPCLDDRGGLLGHVDAAVRGVRSLVDLR